jgi:hypothetical protein
VGPSLGQPHLTHPAKTRRATVKRVLVSLKVRVVGGDRRIDATVLTDSNRLKRYTETVQPDEDFAAILGTLLEEALTDSPLEA